MIDNCMLDLAGYAQSSFDHIEELVSLRSHMILTPYESEPIFANIC